MEELKWLIAVPFAALALYLATNLIFGAYFKAKERFVDRLHNKMKEQRDGKG